MKQKLVDIWKKYYIYILSTGIPALIMLGVWIVVKVGPGGRSLIIVDGLHQYMPFFSDYYEKLKTGGSLFYSFQEGMGTNFLSLWSYYLASPINLLILFFPKSQLNTAVSLIVTLKIILCGWSFAYAALHRSRVKYQHPGVIPLAVAYSMSNFVIGYYWNVMWMDCIFIFPLIILGFDYLVEKKDARLYILTLFYALFCNYYIGFMICIFLVIWAITYHYNSLRDLGRTAWLFAVSSLLAGGMAAIVLVPAYKGIMETASAERVLPGWEQYGSYWNILQAHLLGSEPINNQTNDGGVNLYCGIFALFLVFIYLFSRQFKLADKIKYIGMLGLMFVSFNTEILNYIWHGFHNQYGIPNRFSFLYIFILLWIGYEVLLRYRRISIVEQILACIAVILLSIFSYTQVDVKLEKICYILVIALAVLYMLLSFAYYFHKKKGKVWRAVLAGVMTAEMIGGAIYGWSCNGSIDVNYYFGDTQAIETIVEKAYAEDDSFYRMEIGNTKMLDEPTWHNLRCVTLFGSTARGNMVTAMGRLGFYTGANEYLYCGATPLTNAITGMKYVMYREGDFNNNILVYKETVDGVSVYENPYYLPVGFCVQEELKDMLATSTYFQVQNDFARHATGIETPLFSEVALQYEAEGTDCTVSVENNKISYTKNGTEKHTVQTSFMIEENMDLYLDISGGNVRQVKVFLDDQQIANDRYQNQAFHVGYLTEGQKVTLEFEFNNNGKDSGTITLHSVQFHSDAWDAVYTELQKNPMDVEEYRDGYIKGTVDADEGQILFLSIPYDEGWKITVDGEEIEAATVMDAFIALELSEGQHEIEMKYTSQGFWQGALLSGICVLLFLLLWGLTVGYQRKHLIQTESDEDRNDAEKEEVAEGILCEQSEDAMQIERSIDHEEEN